MLAPRARDVAHVGDTAPLKIAGYAREAELDDAFVVGVQHSARLMGERTREGRARDVVAEEALDAARAPGVEQRGSKRLLVDSLA